VRCESRVWRGEIRVPRHCGFDGVRQIDFFIWSKVSETQFNLGHFSPVRLRRGRVIIEQPAIVSDSRIVECHARAFVRFALFMTGMSTISNKYSLKSDNFALEPAKKLLEHAKNRLEIAEFALENADYRHEIAEFKNSSQKIRP
jgi:hypothetical protein